MSRFEVLCVTMHQTDFSKIKEMNIHSDVVFANQADCYSFDELEFDRYKAKMITTTQRGVGKNRNTALMYASAEICLFADDDVTYVDNYAEIICKAFDELPDAEVIVFNLTTDSKERPQYQNPRKKKCNKLTHMPYGACRIAFRLNIIQKANIWFTTLFGGGCKFTSGEDSKFLNDVMRNNLKLYMHPAIIGMVRFGNSSWFTGTDECFYYGKGVYYAAIHPKAEIIWQLYFAFRTRKNSKLSFQNRLHWMKNGKKGYKEFLSFEEFLKIYEE